jgi:hypothetical protein
MACLYGILRRKEASREGNMVMPPLVLLLVCAAGEPRLLQDEVAAGVGLLGSGYTAVGGTAVADPQLTVGVGYRMVWSGPTADLGVLVALPLTPDGTSLALTGALRVGWTGQRWSVLGGVLVQWAQDPKAPLSFLPTLHAAVDLGPCGLSAGVLDLLGLVPAHLSVDLKAKDISFSVGWVAPVGLLAALELPAWPGARARLTAFAYRLFQAEFAFLSVGVALGGAR